MTNYHLITYSIDLSLKIWDLKYKNLIATFNLKSQIFQL